MLSVFPLVLIGEINTTTPAKALDQIKEIIENHEQKKQFAEAELEKLLQSKSEFGCDVQRKYRMLALIAHQKMRQSFKEIKALGQDEFNELRYEIIMQKTAAQYLYGLVANPDFALDVRGGRIFFPNMEMDTQLDSRNWKEIEAICTIKVNGQTIPEVAQSKVDETCARNPACRACKDAQVTLAGIQRCLEQIEKHKLDPTKKAE